MTDSGPRHVKRSGDLIPPDQVSALSGLDLITGMIDGTYPAPPIARTLNFQVVAASEGRAVFEGKPGFESYNPFGVVHGGWFGAIMDSCMTCAVQTKLPAGVGITTLEYRVNILRPVFETTERLRAIGEARHVGRKTGVADGRLEGIESGKLYATGATTCLVLKPTPATGEG